MVLVPISSYFTKFFILTPYLSDKVKGDHVSWLGGNRVGGELKLVIGRDGYHHSGSGDSHGLGKPGNKNS